MKSIIKGLHSPDISCLPSYVPPEADTFSFLLQILVGPEGEPGEESFDVVVYTPKWLLAHFPSDTMFLGHGALIVFRYDYNQLTQLLASKFNGIEGESWSLIAERLRLIGKWEFEAYRPSNLEENGCLGQ